MFEETKQIGRYLTLMYNKPLQAYVRAVTDGSLWALKREDFRGVLLTGLSNPSILNVIRSIDVIAKLTLLQLNRLAGSLSEVSFMDGERVIRTFLQKLHEDSCCSQTILVWRLLTC
jgi:CRP-like cAMP-binding protein